MRSQIAILALALPVVLVGCKVKSKTETSTKTFTWRIPFPDIKIDPKFLDSLVTCDELPKYLDREVEKNALTVKGFTDKQDTEHTDCDGKKTLSPKLPLLNFKHDLAIEPPDGIEGKVVSVRVKNTRTCIERKIDVDKKNKFPLTQSAPWAEKPYWLNPDGAIVIGLNNSFLKTAAGLNVFEGLNLLEIAYLNAKGEELAKKSILVNAEIEVRELNGIKTVNACRDEKKKKEQ